MALERQRVFLANREFFQQTKVGPGKLTDQLATRIDGEHVPVLYKQTGYESDKSSKRQPFL